MTAKVEIRTEDIQWATTHGIPGRDGRTIITVPSVEPLQFGGASMVRFHLGADLPRDWRSPWGMSPAAWVVSE